MDTQNVSQMKSGSIQVSFIFPRPGWQDQVLASDFWRMDSQSASKPWIDRMLQIIRHLRPSAWDASIRRCQNVKLLQLSHQSSMLISRGCSLLNRVYGFLILKKSSGLLDFFRIFQIFQIFRIFSDFFWVYEDFMNKKGFKHWYQGVVHSQISSTDFKSSKKIQGFFLDFFGFSKFFFGLRWFYK